MNAREQLEFAAKAAEVNISGVAFYSGAFVWIKGEMIVASWSPLNDCDDALRLAAKLHLRVDFRPRAVCVDNQNGRRFPPFGMIGDETDLSKAACRAITRAAAELGKDIP